MVFLGKVKFMPFHLLQALNKEKGSKPKPISYTVLSHMSWRCMIQRQEKNPAPSKPLSHITQGVKGLSVTCFFIVNQSS